MADSTPLVSVVIPAYNAQDHLADCLASVRAEVNGCTVEVIVVDDGSVDDTVRIAHEQPGVRCIHQANKGPSAARNTGIAAANGDYVAFLDADDLWPAGKLAAQVQLLQDHPEVAMVFGDCRQFDAQGSRALTEFEANGMGAAAWGAGPVVPDAYRRLLQDSFITTGSVVVRRAVLKAAGGFAEDLRLVEDLDLWLRIARHHPIAWCDRECLLRRRHDSNISRDAEAMGLAYLEVLQRHRRSWSTAEVASQGLDAGQLAARHYLYLAELARSSGKTGTAFGRIGQSLRSSPRPQTLWRATKVAVKLVLGRRA